MGAAGRHLEMLRCMIVYRFRCVGWWAKSKPSLHQPLVFLPCLLSDWSPRRERYVQVRNVTLSNSRLIRGTKGLPQMRPADYKEHTITPRLCQLHPVLQSPAVQGCAHTLRALA